MSSKRKKRINNEAVWFFPLLFYSSPPPYSYYFVSIPPPCSSGNYSWPTLQLSTAVGPPGLAGRTADRIANTTVAVPAPAHRLLTGANTASVGTLCQLIAPVECAEVYRRSLFTSFLLLTSSSFQSRDGCCMFVCSFSPLLFIYCFIIWP